MSERTVEAWVDGRGWVRVRPEVAIRLLRMRGAKRTRLWREHKEREMTDGDPSLNGERIFHGGRIVGHVDLRLNAGAGLSASEANVLCRGLRDAAASRIERKRREDSDA